MKTTLSIFGLMAITFSSFGAQLDKAPGVNSKATPVEIELAAQIEKLAGKDMKADKYEYLHEENRHIDIPFSSHDIYYDYDVKKLADWTEYMSVRKNSVTCSDGVYIRYYMIDTAYRIPKGDAEFKEFWSCNASSVGVDKMSVYIVGPNQKMGLTYDTMSTFNNDVNLCGRLQEIVEGGLDKTLLMTKEDGQTIFETKNSQLIFEPGQFTHNIHLGWTSPFPLDLTQHYNLEE